MTRYVKCFIDKQLTKRFFVLTLWKSFKSGFSYFRGDHIVPNFEEIWPSKKGPKANKPKTGLEYYYDAMLNGPNLSGKTRMRCF